MPDRRNESNIVAIKQKKSRKVGILLIIFAIYLIFIFVKNMSKEHISVYELKENSIADDETLRGLIIRDEQLVTTENKGFINYYVGEGAKVGKKTKVYSVDESGEISKLLSNTDGDDLSLSDDFSKTIRKTIADYRHDFDLSDYDSISSFRYALENDMLNMYADSLSKKLNKIISDENVDQTSFDIKKAICSGVVSLSSDGMEGVTVDSVKPEYFDDMTDHWKQLRSDDMCDAGKGVYRIVKSEKWSLMVPLNEHQMEKIKPMEYVNLTLKKENIQLSAPLIIHTIDGKYYAQFDFDKYMIRFLNDRYTDVRLDLSSGKGLKVPKSAVIEKKFYTIPKRYLTKGTEKNNSGNGFYTIKTDKSGQKIQSFNIYNIYYEDSQENLYISMDDMEAGTVIVPEADSGESNDFTVSSTESLKGVYNCNYGYCRFQAIDILSENDEYSIISKDTVYGPATYDHIILNANMIDEDDIIY